MTGAAPSRPRGLLPGLAVTETVSWGICYYGFAVLLPPMERDLGWSRATLVGAFTIAVIVSGFAAFPVGRWLDRGSARLLMTTGSVLATLGVLAWSQSRTVPAFYGSWLLIGIAMGLVLYEPAQVVLIKQFGHRATWAITTLTLVAGFASTIFQPTIAALQDARGWRSALTICAVGARRRHDHHPRPRAARPTRPHPAAPGDATDVVRRCGPPAMPVRDPAMLGLTVAFTLSIGAMSAAIVHLIPYLTDHGWTDLHAAIAAGLIGATQVAARVVFGLFADRVAAARLALVVLLVPVGGIVLLGIVERRRHRLARGRLARHRAGHHHPAAATRAVQTARPARLRTRRRPERSVEHRRPRRRPAAVGRRRRPWRRGLSDRVRRVRRRRDRRGDRRLPQPADPATGPRPGARRPPPLTKEPHLMPRMKPDDVADFLAQPHIGVLATLRRDGRP